MARPATDETISINDDLNVVYSLWLKGAQFRRQPGWWSHMLQREYIEPTTNPTLVRLVEKGLQLGFVEHVSFTVSGRVRYVYDTAQGFAEDIGMPGDHNVENGGGYLPVHAFTRIVEEDHISCCIVPKPGQVASVRYAFSIETEADPTANFSHQIQGVADTFIIGRLIG